MPTIDGSGSGMENQFSTSGSKSKPTRRKKKPTGDLRSTIDEIIRARPDELRDGYLQRLRRLLRLRRDHYEELNEQGLRLLDRSIFAAYCDCIDIGQSAAAREVLKDVRLTLSLARSHRVRKGDKV